MITGCSAVRLAHLLWEQGVGGSNPLTPNVAQSVRALDCGSRGWGFESPHSPNKNASVAQLAEQRTLNPRAGGSNPP